MGHFNKKGLNIYFDDLNFEDIINRKTFFITYTI